MTRKAVVDEADGNAFSVGLNFHILDCDEPVVGVSNPVSRLGAVACATGVSCNELSGNVDEDIDGDPTVAQRFQSEVATISFRMVFA